MCTYVWIQQTKTKYEIEAEKRELERLLEKRTQEVENVSGKFTTEAIHLDKLCMFGSVEIC